jgi:hypothetical protein
MLSIHKGSISDKESQLNRLDESIDKATEAYRLDIDLLDTIPGVGKESAINIISETGVDMSRFPDETHLSSWAGMSPGNCETGGKKKCKNGTWQQPLTKHIGRMWLGCYPKKGLLFKTQVRKFGWTTW